MCEGIFSSEEIKTAVFQLKFNKSPGLSSEFYKDLANYLTSNKY